MLPVDELRPLFDATPGPLVVTAPPGSGKSTRIPLWLDGPVLVVQPRRVAARSLSSHLRGQGHDVGFAVRGESSRTDAPVVFVTPGVALRMDRSRFRAVVLDEFHERSLDLDLLLGICHADPRHRLVVLSATLQGDRLADHLDGTHLTAQGRMFPVEVRYAKPGRELPHDDRLGDRVRDALRDLNDVPGDRLVFVPGRAEMGEVARALASDGDEVLELHGRLTLDQQSRVFRQGARRRVVVATNVAETSLTLPNIGAVVDTGLVRRTHYHQDRGYLILGPVAMDSADQRAGRAGRLGPGVAVRLWGERAPLRAFTPPELERESLVPFVLAACVAGRPALDLPFLDVPPAHAVQTARDHLEALGALDDGALTSRGELLFRLPLDAHIAHLLVTAERLGGLSVVIDLAAALGSTRPLFRRPFNPDDPEDLRTSGCDATSLVRAVRLGDPKRHGLDTFALRDIRREAQRLRALFDKPPEEPFDRMELARVVVTAWPRAAHVARRRKRSPQWSNGGTEVSLDRRSAVDEDRAEAVLALNFRALGRDRLHRELRITTAMPVNRRELAELGLGRDRAGQAVVKGRKVEVVVERVYAGTILHTRSASPVGAMAHQVLAERLLAGQIWKGFARRFAERHRLASLHAQLEGEAALAEPVALVQGRLARVGLERVSDLSMLEEEDLFPDPVPDLELSALQRDFPSELSFGAVRFRVEVHPGGRTVLLHNLGSRLKKMPPTSWLPAFRGFAVVVVDRNTRKDLRGRR